MAINVLISAGDEQEVETDEYCGASRTEPKRRQPN